MALKPKHKTMERIKLAIRDAHRAGPTYPITFRGGLRPFSHLRSASAKRSALFRERYGTGRYAHQRIRPPEGGDDDASGS